MELVFTDFCDILPLEKFGHTRYNPFYNHSVTLGVSSRIKEANLPRNFTEELKCKGDDDLAALCFLLLLACCFDYSKRRIPNLLLAGTLVIGLAEAFGGGGGREVLFFLIRMAVVILTLYPFFRIGTVGAGDVKLLGVCAGYFPSDKILLFLFFSMLLSAAFSLMKLWREKNVKERFAYLGEYLTDVIRTGNLRLYFKNKKELNAAGICLSGPILISAMMHWGGIY